MRASFVSLAAALGLALALGGPAPAAGITECGSAGTVYSGQVRLVNVTTRGVSCRRARHFARAFTLKSGNETSFACSEDLRCTWRGWSCLNDGRGGGPLDHRCTRGGLVIRWQDAT